MARTQAERTEQTTADLLQVAVELYGRDGYAAVSLDDVARAAGVTKGAVYHHFGSKAALFRAVLISEELRLVDRITAAVEADAADPWVVLHRGCATFLEACLDPAVRQILLLDGPAVLGWRGLRELEDEHVNLLLRHGVRRVSDPADVPARLHVLLGALCEAGLLLADDPGQLPALTRAVDGLIDSYRAS